MEFPFNERESVYAIGMVKMRIKCASHRIIARMKFTHHLQVRNNKTFDIVQCLHIGMGTMLIALLTHTKRNEKVFHISKSICTHQLSSEIFFVEKEGERDSLN